MLYMKMVDRKKQSKEAEFLILASSFYWVTQCTMYISLVRGGGVIMGT